MSDGAWIVIARGRRDARKGVQHDHKRNLSRLRRERRRVPRQRLRCRTLLRLRRSAVQLRVQGPRPDQIGLDRSLAVQVQEQQPEVTRTQSRATAFVIYGLEEALQRVRKRSKETGAPSARVSRPFARTECALCFRTGFIEPVFSGGQMTGDYRACRRCPDGVYEMGQFTSREEALGWAKRYEKR